MPPPPVESLSGNEDGAGGAPAPAAAKKPWSKPAIRYIEEGELVDTEAPPPPMSWRTTVTYRKSPCSAADVRAEFFLQVVPEDVEDLPADRRQHGFGNMHFHYGEHAALAFGGQCIAQRTLPDYLIARIRTGQFAPEGDLIWTAEFPVAPRLVSE